MKKLILIFLLANITTCVAADSLSGEVKLKAIRYSCMFVSGYADGINDAISFHYTAFKRVHPNANDQFCNPAISWKNKYNGNKLNRTLFVGKTDLFHSTNMLNRGFMIGGSIIVPFERKKWWWYLKELGIDYLINRIGFVTAYNLIYK